MSVLGESLERDLPELPQATFTRVEGARLRPFDGIGGVSGGEHTVMLGESLERDLPELPELL